VDLVGVLPPHVTLFSESQSRVLASVEPEKLADLQDVAGELGVPVHVLGTTGGTNLQVKGLFEIGVEEMRDVYETSLEKMIAGARH
jgi:phosphoribosylformylglycinamidine synthase